MYKEYKEQQTLLGSFSTAEHVPPGLVFASGSKTHKSLSHLVILPVLV